MIQISLDKKDKFEVAIKESNRQLSYRIKIDDKLVDLQQLMSQMIITTDGGFEEYSVGYALTSSLEFSTLKNFSMTESSFVDIEVGLEVGSEVVYIPFQRFYLFDSEVKGMERKVKCYDYMYKLAAKGYFPSQKHTNTAAVCQDMSQQLGVEFQGIINVSIYSEELEGRTYKETLGYIASAMGRNVRVSRDNKIEFFELTQSNQTYSGSDYTSPTTNETNYSISCLEVHYGEKKTDDNGTVIDEGYYRVGEYTTKSKLLMITNPLMKNNESVATEVLRKLKAISYSRFDTTIQLADFRLELGDYVSFKVSDSIVKIPVLYTRYTLLHNNVNLAIQSPTKNEEKKEYSFQGTLTQKVNAVYADLIQVKDLVADKVSVAYLEAEFAKIDKMYVKEAQIENLIAGSISVSTLKADIANINTLVAGKADISELNAAVANINILNADLAIIQHLVAGNISSENIQTGGITSDKLTIVNGFIKNAMIDSLNANKITAGQINTALVNVTSSRGNLVINDNTIQIRDNSRVRVQIGKDASNDYSMSVWDSTGQLMFDARGLKANAIKDSIIRNDMISSGANIDGSKLNISSVVSSINNGTSTLKASKVQFDGIAQTLEVAFNSLKTNVEGIEIGGANIATKTNQGTTGWGWAMEVGGVTRIEHVENNIRGCKFVRNDVVQSGWSYISYGHIGRVKYKSNTEYTISFGVKSSVATQFLVDIKYGNATETLTNSAKTGQCVANEWTKLSVTLKTKTELPSGTQQVLYLTGMNSAVGASYIFRNLKIEVGNKATDWSPAPEDIDSSINSVKEITESNTTAINVAQGKINTLIQDTTIVKDGVETKLKDEYSKLEQTVSGINATVGKQQTTIDDHTGKITATNSELSSLKQSVSGLSASVSSAQTTINSHTTLIGQKANSVDVYTKSQTDAQINIAKESINLGVSQTYETKTNVESKVTSAKQETKSYADTKKAEAISAAATDASNKVNGIELGTTNLVRNSTLTQGSDKKLHWRTIHSGFSIISGESDKPSSNILKGTRSGIATTSIMSAYTNSAKCAPGDTFVFSLEFKVDKVVEWDHTCTFIAEFYDNAGERVQYKDISLSDLKITAMSDGKWVRGYYALQATHSSASQVGMRITLFKNGTIYFREPQIEKGTKGSDWSPSPLDVATDIDSAKSEAIRSASADATTKANAAQTNATNAAATDATSKVNGAKNELNTAINLKASKTDVYTKTETYTKGETDSAIKVAKESIELGVSSKYETKENVESKVTSVTTEVKSYTDGKVGAIEYGGRNYIQNGAPYTADGGWSSAGISSQRTLVDEASSPSGKAIKVLANAAGTGGVYKSPTRALVVGQKYSWSIYLKGSKVMTIKLGLEQGGQRAVNITTEWQRFTHTFTAAASNYRAFTLYAQNIAANDYFMFHSVMAEDGTLPSPWKPAPEDTASDINSAKSELNSVIALKAAKTDVYTKTETYTKSETDSKINIAKDSINLGVSQNYETKTNVTSKVSQAVVDARRIPDTRNTNENPLWYFTNYPKQTITEFKYANIVGVGTATVYGTLTTVVPWTEKSGGYPVQTFRSQSTATFERRGTSDTAWGEWKQVEDTVSSQNKANAAIASANSTLTTTIANYYTKSQTDSAINVAKDSINLSVSSTYETKVDVTTKINGVNSSISALQQRVATAEQKITDSAIITTVKSQFYTKTETDTQITSKGYQTASQVEQTVNNVAFKFNESGGYNLLLNSRWEYDLFNWATPHTSIQRIQDSNTGLYYMRAAMVIGANHGLVQVFKQEKGRTYTASALVDIDEGAIAGVEVSYTNTSGTKVYLGRNTANHPSNYTDGILHFSWTPDVSGDVQINFYTRGGHGSGVTAGKYVRWRYTQVEQGATHTGWSPNPYEIYQGQTLINKNGVRVNASNIGTYTEMNASGFFVKKNDGNLLFEATNKIALYDGKGVSCLTIINDPSASYGNARIDLRGGINFIHNPGVSVGTNQILLGNHDVSNQYGYHNLSIKCWNSMGIQDNNGLTNMFADSRRGRWIMKGALYQNTATPPATFSMNFIGEDDLYDSGYEKQEVIDSVMKLRTGVYVDNDGECCTSIWGGLSDLLTTEYTDDEGYRTLHLNTQALNAALVIMLQEQQARILELENKLLN